MSPVIMQEVCTALGRQGSAPWGGSYPLGARWGAIIGGHQATSSELKRSIPEM